MNVAAQCYIALGIQRSGELRKMAATVVTRYIFEFHRYGYNPGWERCNAIASRFRLTDYKTALLANYPPRK